jgi:1,4-dihydroxy-2-naphthoate polyprenyltransferase
VKSAAQALPSHGPARSSALVWLQAIRPKTLSAGAVPVIIGIGLAYGQGSGRLLPAVAALAGALLIQIGTNLSNDYYDFKRGADTSERLGPVRVTQNGLIAPQVVLAAGLLCFAAAFAVGLYLVALGGWPIAALGAASLLCGFAYTGGPVPLAYVGLGDVFVLAFFGFGAVGGTYFVQTGSLTPAVASASIPAGALGTAILVVNNLRDAATDAKAGKRTLVVRWGALAGKVEYCAMLTAAFAAPLVMWLLGSSRGWPLLSWLSAPLALPPLQRVLKQHGAALNPALGGTARLQLAFGILFAFGLYLSGGTGR